MLFGSAAAFAWRALLQLKSRHTPASVDMALGVMELFTGIFTKVRRLHRVSWVSQGQNTQDGRPHSSLCLQAPFENTLPFLSIPAIPPAHLSQASNTGGERCLLEQAPSSPVSGCFSAAPPAESKSCVLNEPQTES